MPWEYTGWKKAEVRGLPRPGGGGLGGQKNHTSKIDFKYFDDPFMASP